MVALPTFRVLILLLLIVQNSMYTLLRRYYSMGPTRDAVTFPVILLVTEVMKFMVSAALVELPSESKEHDRTPSPRHGDTWMQTRILAVRRVLMTSIPMAVPALTYAIMNMISYKALEMIDATVFAMVAQLKIVSTALFSWPVLGRLQSPPQWRAIVVLTLAVIIITYQRGESRSGGQGISAKLGVSFALGVVLTLIEVSLSGLISTYFEKYLKDGTLSVWGRNLQLSFWSIAVYILVQATPSNLSTSVMGADAGHVFDNFVSAVFALLRPLPLLLVLLGGGGGLLVAFAIKHADAVLKSMATAFSLVIVVLGEVILMGGGLDPVICMASAIAVLGLQIYQDAPKAAPPEVQAAKEGGANGCGKGDPDEEEEQFLNIHEEGRSHLHEPETRIGRS